jgi:hypothetical protein
VWFILFFAGDKIFRRQFTAQFTVRMTLLVIGIGGSISKAS